MYAYNNCHLRAFLRGCSLFLWVGGLWNIRAHGGFDAHILQTDSMSKAQLLVGNTSPFCENQKLHPLTWVSVGLGCGYLLHLVWISTFEKNGNCSYTHLFYVLHFSVPPSIYTNCSPKGISNNQSCKHTITMCEHMIQLRFHIILECAHNWIVWTHKKNVIEMRARVICLGLNHNSIAWAHNSIVSRAFVT